jgi:hypothetical protein
MNRILSCVLGFLIHEPAPLPSLPADQPQKGAEGRTRTSRNQRSADSLVREFLVMGKVCADKAVRAPGIGSRFQPVVISILHPAPTHSGTPLAEREPHSPRLWQHGSGGFNFQWQFCRGRVL